MTYRERREARAERLRGWADGREAKADQAYQGARQIMDMIPLGQPILVGHHSEGRHRRDLDRIDSRMRASVESSEKAKSMRSRADNIEAAAAGAIYDDDPDAIERLAEKLAGLEARREAVKAHNKEMRKPTACDHPADCDCRQRFGRECSCKRHPLPSYVLQNLGGNITRTRQRLEGLRRLAKVHAAPVVDETERDDGGTHRVTSAREEIEYPGKPSAEVRAAIKAQGYRWDRVAGVWWRRLSQGHAPDIDLVNGY